MGLGMSTAQNSSLTASVLALDRVLLYGVVDLGEVRGPAHHLDGVLVVALVVGDPEGGDRCLAVVLVALAGLVDRAGGRVGEVGLHDVPDDARCPCRRRRRCARGSSDGARRRRWCTRRPTLMGLVGSVGTAGRFALRPLKAGPACTARRFDRSREPAQQRAGEERKRRRVAQRDGQRSSLIFSRRRSAPMARAGTNDPASARYVKGLTRASLPSQGPPAGSGLFRTAPASVRLVGREFSARAVSVPIATTDG